MTTSAGVPEKPLLAWRRKYFRGINAHSAVSCLYFVLILVLGKDQIRWSVVVAGVVLSLTMTNGFFTAALMLYVNDLRLIKQSPFVSWIYTALSKPGAVYIILVVMQLGGVAMAVLAAMDLAELGYHVAMTYFAVECTLMVTVINACGLSLVRTIDSSLANRPSSAAETKGGRRIMTARDVQDARLATVRQHIKYMVVFLFVMTPTVILLLLLGTATAYGRGSPLLFFGMPMGLVPTIWFEINLLLHSPKKSAPSRLVALMKLGWSSFRLAAHQSRGASGYFSPDTALGDTKRLSSSESEGQYGKRGVVVPTENGPVCAAVRSGDAARLNT